MLAEMAERDWPGNVRELRNAAERLVLGLDASPHDAAKEDNGRLADKVAAYEKGLIASAIAAHGGALKPVYESLGISRKTLYEKMQKFGLDKKLVAADFPQTAISDRSRHPNPKRRNEFRDAIARVPVNDVSKVSDVEGSADQRLGIGLFRRLEDRVSFAFLDDLAVLHDDHIVRHRLHHRKIVADEDVGEPM